MFPLMLSAASLKSADGNFGRNLPIVLVLVPDGLGVSFLIPFLLLVSFGVRIEVFFLLDVKVF